VNLLLLLGVILLAERLKTDWMTFEKINDVASTVDAMLQQDEFSLMAGASSMRQAEGFPYFTVIWEKDLFREDRRPKAGGTAGQVERGDRKIARWQFRPVLHGVMQVREKKQAIMTIYENKNKSGHLRTVEIGDEIQGYIVTGIEDSIVRLSSQKGEELIDMVDNDLLHSDGGADTKTPTVKVITVGTAPRPVKASAKITTQVKQKQNMGLQVTVVEGSSVQRGQLNTRRKTEDFRKNRRRARQNLSE